MIEVITIVFLLGFLVYKDIQYYKDRNKFEEAISVLPQKLETITSNLFKEREKTFTLYLKHIQTLEKMAFPKPVTTKMVREVLNRTPELSPNMEPFENQIEKDPDKDTVLDSNGKPVDPNQIEVNDQNFGDIPITSDTKVAFEDELPTRVMG